MEDASLIAPNISNNLHLFAIFDGHGGLNHI